jgi:GxxExxY protein
MHTDERGCMNTPEKQNRINKITEVVIGCAFQVHNVLKEGCMEKVYENALTHDLRKAGLRVAQQAPLKVIYDGVVVGEFIADLLVEECVIVELKAVRMLTDVHVAQCISYLTATGLSICLLLNFSTSKVQVKRVVRNF